MVSLPVRVRILSSAIPALLVVLYAIGLSVEATAQENQIIDEIVAVVDDDIILRSDVNALVASVVQQQGAPFTSALWLQALEEMIDQKVVLTYARKDTNVTVSTEQVDQELDSRVGALSAQAGGEQRLEEFYGKSILQIKDDLRERLREQMLAQEYQRQQLSGIKITPSEVQRWFSQFPTDSLPDIPLTVRVSHIVRFPQVDPVARTEAIDIINVLRDSVLAGASFEDLARQFSDDPGSAPNGGRYESMRLSELVPEFGAVASNLERGSISQVFETAFGFHFMRLNNRVGDVIDVNHILISVSDARVLPENAIAYLTAVKDTLTRYPVSFELMAKRHSEDSQSATRGGQVIEPRSGDRDLPLEALGPTWVSTLGRLGVGEISEPVETQLLDGRKAYHLVRLDRRTPAHKMNLEQDYERIEQYALSAKQSGKRAEWLNRLRRNVFISVRVSPDNPLERADSAFSSSR